ncbi:MauE/DoxX family redox-associated membrane protein [Paractinoplanes hotanensis]|uniref:Methylamine utilisation protein MauE domain-containing protein n=1 Tax=Paractinoplanes hotanensis TaxID=2906497 RepID=A0ABT0Y4B6_9ACTN|nr:MauE/DoxX family redox-associated membrane protein [Actinoplanes hotanensis]MCM4080894.1 hypothetical protein [Actinoplanes hotanensis]
MTDHVVDAVRLAVAVTLLLAGGAKLFSPRALARALAEMSGRPGRTGVFVTVARTVAVVELTAAVLLAGGWFAPGGAVLAGGVGVGIASFAGAGLVLRRRPACGCFGADSGRPVGPANVAAGLALAAGAVLTGLGADGDAGAADRLVLAALGALVVVLVRRWAVLVRPFGRHFRIFAEAPVAPAVTKPS